jgi:hypothetical protein
VTAYEDSEQDEISVGDLDITSSAFEVAALGQLLSIVLAMNFNGGSPSAWVRLGMESSNHRLECPHDARS